MKRIIFSAFILTGCALQPSVLQQQTDIEGKASELAFLRIERDCYKERKYSKIPKNEIVAATECQREIMNNELAPHAVVPGIYRVASAKMLIAAEKYSKGKISQNEWSAELDLITQEMLRDRDESIQRMVAANPSIAIDEETRLLNALREMEQNKPIECTSYSTGSMVNTYCQ